MNTFGLHKIVESTPVIPPRIVLGLPANWITRQIGAAGQAFMNTLSGLVVLASSDTMETGERYLHISCSYRDRLPSWDDLKAVKDLFIGDDKEAYQVLPRKEDYVNVHPYCLHLWAKE